MKKLIANIKILLRGIREMNRLGPSMTVGVIAGSLVSGVLPFVNIYFSAAILEELSGAKDKKTLLTYVCLSLGLNFVLGILSKYFQRLHRSGYNILYNNERNKTSKKLVSVDYETLESTQFQGKVTKLTNHREESWGSVFTRLAWVVGSWVSGAVTIGFCIAFIAPFFRVIFIRTGDSFIESPWLGVTVIAAVLVGVVVVLLLSSSLNKKTHRMRNQYLDINRLFRYYSEMLTDYKTGKEIRIFKEQDLIERHATQELIGKGVGIQRALGDLMARSATYLALIGALLGFGVYLLIGLKGLLGLFGVGSLVRYMGSFLQLVQGMTNVASGMGNLNSIIPGFSYYFDVMDAEPAHENGERTPDTQKQENIIEFKDVSFQYPGTEHYALRNVSFRLRAGERFAVVGENGSGKTTFIKLLCRLYDAQEGEILLNGVNIKDYDEREYRRLFSIVFQDFKIFSFPIGKNIASADLYDMDRAADCVAEVGLQKRISHMPKGMDTFAYRDCDEDGIEISGGEAQKLALARALYKDAPFIVLDEPTAALDPIAEFEMYSNFDNLVGDKAAIYISHRLSSCRFCEKIAVFEHGEITQLGTHAELIQNEAGKYHELWFAQARYYV